MSRVFTSLVMVFSLLLASSVAAQSASLKAQPGYVDFSGLSELSSSPPKVEVSLSGALLKFFGEAAKEEDAELAATLSKLMSIRVSVFELDSTRVEQARDEANRIASRLAADDWERTVLVRDEDATVHMFIKSSADSIAGMTVMVVEPGSEAVFINIVGEIDPAQLGRVASRFGVSLDDVDL